MTTLAEIYDELVDTLQDEGYTEAWILKRINNCLKLCARRVLLPALEASGELTTVTTGPTVDVPESWNYQRGIYYAEVEDAPEIMVLGSLSLLLRKYPNAETELESGDIEFVTIVNGQVFYYPIPSEAKTLKVKFYEEPTRLTHGRTEITYIPDELLELLILPFVLWRAYFKSENGSENGYPNTNKYKKEFFEGLALLDEAFDQGQSYPNYDRSSGWI